MAVYLTDAASAPTAFELAALDKDARVVLWQDGVVYAGRAPQNVACYAVTADLERRGLGSVVRNHVKRIDYHELVDLLFRHYPVVNLG